METGAILPLFQTRLKCVWCQFFCNKKCWQNLSNGTPNNPLVHVSIGLAVAVSSLINSFSFRSCGKIFKDTNEALKSVEKKEEF